MLFGIFKSGSTVNGLTSRLDRLARQRAALGEDIAQAVADRQAAIRSIEQELVDLSSLQRAV